MRVWLSLCLTTHCSRWYDLASHNLNIATAHVSQVDVLVNNGGYGAVISSLQRGIPMVLAGQGQDKNLTNTIVEWKKVGVNLGTMRPSVAAVREGVMEVLGDEKYKHNAVAMSKTFEKYDLATVFDGIIQDVVKKWAREKPKASEK
jgi:UDP:flavonoid glycosyltransferase YjiC (YdhE family)